VAISISSRPATVKDVLGSKGPKDSEAMLRRLEPLRRILRVRTPSVASLARAREPAYSGIGLTFLTLLAGRFTAMGIPFFQHPAELCLLPMVPGLALAARCGVRAGLKSAVSAHFVDTFIDDTPVHPGTVANAHRVLGTDSSTRFEDIRARYTTLDKAAGGANVGAREKEARIEELGRAYVTLSKLEAAGGSALQLGRQSR
jgi:hypothetical protein